MSSMYIRCIIIIIYSLRVFHIIMIITIIDIIIDVNNIKIY